MEQEPSQGRGETAKSGPRLRLAGIPGATPDKWADRWRRRHPELGLAVDYYDEAGQVERVRRGTADVGYIRMLAEEAAPDGDPAGPGEPTSGRADPPSAAPQRAEALVAGELGERVAAGELHRVILYREEPVVCAAHDHWVAAAEESVTWEDIAEEPLLRPEQMRQDWDATLSPPVHTPRTGADLARAERLTVEVVATGAGLLILPNSVARMFGRKDVVLRRVEGLPGYDVALAWRRDRDDAVIQEFIGIARGRKPGSGRTELPQKSARPKAASKKTPPPRRGKSRPRRDRASGRRRSR